MMQHTACTRTDHTNINIQMSSLNIRRIHYQACGQSVFLLRQFVLLPLLELGKAHLFVSTFVAVVQVDYQLHPQLHG